MAYESSLVQDFLRISTGHIEQRGWHSHIVRVQTGYERAALQALSSGEPAIVWVHDHELDGPLGEALEQAHESVVLLGNYTENSALRCVLADDARAVRIAMRHLQNMGHQRIGFVCGARANHNEAVQLDAWRDALCEYSSTDAIENLRIPFEANPMADATEASYHAVCQYLRDESEEQREPITAIITTADETTVGALAACNDLGRSVPEQISLLNLQDNSTMKFLRPPVSCIDINLAAQIDAAFQILEAAVAGRPAPYRERVVRVDPHLVERSTVTRPTVQV